jgi:hypothetical protein
VNVRKSTDVSSNFLRFSQKWLEFKSASVMESKVSQVFVQFKMLSEEDKKLVLQKILEDRRNQVQAMNVMANTVLQNQHQNN